jgi:glycosyltransferase involved in cell wall biosynthesis
VKIRVLEVLASLRRGGAERVAVSLARGLDPDRFETEVVSLYGAFATGFERVLEEHHIPTRHLGKQRGLDLRMYPRLAGVFRSFKPGLVHTHSYVLRYTWPAGLLAGLAGSRQAPGAMVHTVHNVAHREVEWLGRAIHRVAFRHGVIPVAVSGAVARSFREVYGFDPAATIPNGVDAEHFFRPQARQEWRRAQGFSSEDGLVVSIARLEPQKNPLGLIESFARALRDDPRWHLLLAGDGSLREAAAQTAGKFALGGRVHCLGVREDVAETLAASDVFALASHWEGNPMSVLEAMAAGLPVVATAVGGVPELVEDGATGLLAPAGDVQALAEALAAMAGDPQRRQELGAAARKRAAQFSVSAMVAAYSQLFERIAAPRNAGFRQAVGRRQP